MLGVSFLVAASLAIGAPAAFAASASSQPPTLLIGGDVGGPENNQVSVFIHPSSPPSTASASRRYPWLPCPTAYRPAQTSTASRLGSKTSPRSSTTETTRSRTAST